MTTVFSIVNQVPTVGADVIFDVKGILVSSSWTVVSSSNGTVAVAGDSWLSASVGNNDYAWIQLRSPDSGVRYLSFQRNNNHYQWRVQYLSGSYNNDGDATTLPTAAAGTVRWVFGDTVGNYGSLVQSSIDERHHVVALSGSHSSTGSFWFGTFTKTTGTPRQIMVFDPLDSHHQADLDPICIFSIYPLDFNYIGQPQYGPLGDVAGTWGRLSSMEWSDVNNNRMDAHGMGTNDMTSKMDLMPTAIMRLSSYGGVQGFKGYSYMTLLGANPSLGFGDTLNVEGESDVTGSKSHVVIGKYSNATTIVPWDGTSDLTI